MRYATADAFRTALDIRLKRRAAESGGPLDRMRKYVAFERLLARLHIIAPDRYVLKGGYALDLRLGDRARSTQDLDVAVTESEAEVVHDLALASTLDLTDYFQFEFNRTRALDNLDEATAVRFSIQSFVADKRFELFRLDVGVEGLGTAHPEALTGGDFLTFADDALVEHRVVPLSQHVAEKIHAYTRIYSHVHGSSRVKDLIDLVLISSHLTLFATDLSRALFTTFSTRRFQTIPVFLPRPPAAWETPYRGLANEVALEQRLEEGWEAASAFLNPVLGGDVAAEAVWSPDDRSWIVL